MNIKNLRIGKRLAGSFGIMGLLLLGLAWVAWWGIGKVQMVMAEAQSNGEKVATALVMADALNKLYTVQGTDMLSVNSAEHAANQNKIEQYRQLADADLRLLQQGAVSEKGQQMIAQLAQVLTKIQEESKQALEMAQDFQGGDGLRVYNEQFGPSLVKLDLELKNYLDYRQERLKALQEKSQSTISSVHTILFVATLIGLFLAGLFGLTITRSISAPLARGVQVLNIIAAGDLSKEIPAGILAPKDEIGQLLRAMEEMRINLATMVRELLSSIASLFADASELEEASEVLNLNSSRTLELANSVTSNASGLSTNMSSVAAAMEEAYTNVRVVAQSVKEISTNIDKIDREVDQTKQSTQNSVLLAQQATAHVNELEGSAEEIGVVTETIKSISEKTNLLALNATIEAARAGEAGKGFAVVAHEIKELAKQTADSTVDISKRLQIIQKSAQNTVRQIREIAGAIEHVDSTVDNIATAVSHQNAMTTEISGSVEQTSLGLAEINKNIGLSGVAIEATAKDVTGVNNAAQGINQASNQVQKSAQGLKHLADNLNKMMARFTITQSGFVAGPVKLAHSQWKKRLSDLMNGRQSLQPSQVSDHHFCDFGKWYFGEGQNRFSALTIFQEIDSQHQKVHDLAREIAQLHLDGEVAQALQQFHEFHAVTGQLFLMLDQLEQETN